MKGLSGQTEEFEDFLLLNAEGQRRLAAKYAHHACEERLAINWKRTPYNRVALMTRIVFGMGPECRYLEIGCDKDELFHAVGCRHKVGVDPVKGGTLRMTSDEFFAGNSDRFDVVFIDGLHTYRQTRRDVENALACTRPGGFIGIHDLVPVDWREEHSPRLQGMWTGDVWKVGVELAATPGLDFRLVLIDHGVGLIRVPEGGIPTLADMGAELEQARFAWFHRAFPGLPTLDWDGALDWIGKDMP